MKTSIDPPPPVVLRLTMRGGLLARASYIASCIALGRVNSLTLCGV
jgi:hypothetical protein